MISGGRVLLIVAALAERFCSPFLCDDALVVPVFWLGRPGHIAISRSLLMSEPISIGKCFLHGDAAFCAA